ncbi:MAG: hypothetical protein LBQ90_12705 [Synergistaceae bacterium]|nr:hypothetical protein [Synergistaceae bacterium]
MADINDPWAGRNAGMRCKTCIFFVKKGEKIDPEKSAFGRCRAHAPTMRGFVPVWEMDLCGEHRLDENKI